MFGKALGMSPVQRYLEQLHADLLEIGGGTLELLQTAFHVFDGILIVPIGEEHRPDGGAENSCHHQNQNRQCQQTALRGIQCFDHGVCPRISADR